MAESKARRRRPLWGSAFGRTKSEADKEQGVPVHAGGKSLVEALAEEGEAGGWGKAELGE